MGKYRKKPVIVEAIQFNNLNREEIEKFVGEPLEVEINDIAWQAGQGAPFMHLKIKTLEGIMTANPQDFIIKGVNGEFYPCKPDIFEKTYEVVEENNL